MKSCIYCSRRWDVEEIEKVRKVSAKLKASDTIFLFNCRCGATYSLDSSGAKKYQYKDMASKSPICFIDSIDKYL